MVGSDLVTVMQLPSLSFTYSGLKMVFSRTMISLFNFSGLNSSQSPPIRLKELFVNSVGYSAVFQLVPNNWRTVRHSAEPVSPHEYHARIAFLSHQEAVQQARQLAFAEALRRLICIPRVRPAGAIPRCAWRRCYSRICQAPRGALSGRDIRSGAPALPGECCSMPAGVLRSRIPPRPARCAVFRRQRFSAACRIFCAVRRASFRPGRAEAVSFLHLSQCHLAFL